MWQVGANEWIHIRGQNLVTKMAKACPHGIQVHKTSSGGGHVCVVQKPIVNNYQDHFEMNLRYMILRAVQAYGTRILAILQTLNVHKQVNALSHL